MTTQPRDPTRELVKPLPVASDRSWADPAFVDAVEQCMLGAVHERSGTVVEAAAASIEAGGKRLRPLLVLAADATGGIVDRPIPEWNAQQAQVLAAAAVELIHTASLIHDDVLDQATMRRGTRTVVDRWGTAIAIAAGDLLFSLAFSLLLQIDDPDWSAGERAGILRQAVTILAGAARQLAEGEALQAEQTSLGIDPAEYELRCARKTGVLFGASLGLGGLVTGADPTTLAVLDQLGSDVGIAFQIADDVLDCDQTATPDQLGKIPGADLRSGTVTLPILLAAQADPRITEHFPAHDPDTVGTVLAWIASGPALDQSRARAAELCHGAIASLETLPAGFDLGALRDVVLQSVHRLH